MTRLSGSMCIRRSKAERFADRRTKKPTDVRISLTVTMTRVVYLAQVQHSDDAFTIALKAQNGNGRTNHETRRTSRNCRNRGPLAAGAAGTRGGRRLQGARQAI